MTVTYLDARPPLNAGLAAILRRHAQSLADDFGRDGWHFFVSDAPAGWLYATWAAQPGETWHAGTALGLRRQVVARMAEARRSAVEHAERVLARWSE